MIDFASRSRSFSRGETAGAVQPGPSDLSWDTELFVLQGANGVDQAGHSRSSLKMAHDRLGRADGTKALGLGPCSKCTRQGRKFDGIAQRINARFGIGREDGGAPAGPGHPAPEGVPGE